METGHIKITDKVYFVPEGLPKPSRKNFMKRYGKGHESLALYTEKIKEYEASKKKVVVSNETYSVTNTTNGYWILLKKDWKIVKNNQEVEAEITGKALITKI